MKTPLTSLVLLLLPLASGAQNRLMAPIMQSAPSSAEQAPQSGPNVITPPPIKMGLWKSINTATVAGLQLPPEVAERMKAMGKSLGQPQTITTLSCITREKWQQMFNRQQQGQNCSFSNVQQSPSHMSADVTCTTARGSESSGHMDLTFDSDTSIHGKFHMSMTLESQPEPMTVDSKLQGDYQGSDCQGISPDSPKIVH